MGGLGLKCFARYCSRQNLESSDAGSVGTLSVLDADWSVVTKYTGVFDLMNIDELRLSATATVGRAPLPRGHRPISYVVTRTFMSAGVPQAYKFPTFKQY